MGSKHLISRAFCGISAVVLSLAVVQTSSATLDKTIRSHIDIPEITRSGSGKQHARPGDMFASLFDELAFDPFDTTVGNPIPDLPPAAAAGLDLVPDLTGFAGGSTSSVLVATGLDRATFSAPQTGTLGIDRGLNAVPTPGAFALLALSGAAALRRRRA